MWADIDLNEAQRSAVEHGLCAGASAGLPPPLLVIAGAGTGKTATLAARAARLVVEGADPNRILLITFSRRAATELQRRVGARLQRALGLPTNRPPPRLSWAGTFHGIGARLLREYAERIGLASSFTIQDRADSEDLIALLRHDLGLARTDKRFPLAATCLAIYSRTVNSERPLAEVLDRAFPWCAGCGPTLKTLFGAYADEKANQQVLDYDDLLLGWWQTMDADPALAAEIGARFDHVLVDEYQDTNRLQAAILEKLKPEGRGLVVVGDDAQSIYAFRAAEVRNILDFPNRFEPPARVVTLERNYRSTQPILEASNRVIALAAEGFPKRLWTDRLSSARPSLTTVADEPAQAGWVVDQVLRHREAGIALKRQAVLFRSSHHALALELELARRNVPFVKFGGLKFLEAAHVKDLMSMLRWSQNLRHRMAALRTARRVEGIGMASAKRLADALVVADDPGGVLRCFRPPAAAASGWAAFLEAFERCRAPGLRWPAPLDPALTWILGELPRLYDDAAVRAADLRTLVRLARAYGSRESFLAEMTLDPPEAVGDEAGVPLLDEDYLILSTLHSAKGQEWEAVFLLNMVDGCMPSDLATGQAAEIEEERRLLYVGMTRARRHLHLVAPQRFYVTQQSPRGDRHLYATVSRFLPSTLLPWFDTEFGVEAPEACEPTGASADMKAPRPSVAIATENAAAFATTATAVTKPPGVGLELAATLRRRWA